MGFDDDKRGQIFSMDLLIALIPLTIALGMVAADMDNVLYMVQDTVYRGSTERAAFNTADALLGTSGSPWNWEITNASNRTVGFAPYDTNKLTPVKDTISSDKLSAASNTDIQNLLGDNYGYFLNVTSADGSTSWGTRSSGGLGYNNSASDVVRVEKEVLYSKLNSVSFIKGQIRGSNATIDYSNPPNAFQTSAYYNQTFDYYIVVGNNSGYTWANVTINSNIIVMTNLTQPYLINSSYLNMNQTNPTQLLNNNVKVTTGSSYGSYMDLYIVQVKKGTSTSELTANNVVPKYSRFILYVWVK
ncbi:MAG TPA: hypothetical protein VK426_03770 [Methanobacterium sp.]|nr:hypothetical protein [Methanobacterium sp.]